MWNRMQVASPRSVVLFCAVLVLAALALYSLKMWMNRAHSSVSKNGAFEWTDLDKMIYSKESRQAFEELGIAELFSTRPADYSSYDLAPIDNRWAMLGEDADIFPIEDESTTAVDIYNKITEKYLHAYTQNGASVYSDYELHTEMFSLLKAALRSDLGDLDEFAVERTTWWFQFLFKARRGILSDQEKAVLVTHLDQFASWVLLADGAVADLEERIALFNFASDIKDSLESGRPVGER